MNSKNLTQATPLPEYDTLVSERFQEELQQNLEYLKRAPGTSSIPITQRDADVYYGDFHGLLLHIGQQRHHLWILTILNGLTNSGEYNSDFLSIIVPDADRLQRIADIYNTVYV